MNQLPDFAALFRASPSPCLLMDCQLHIIGANQAYLASTGRVEAELLGRYVFEAFPENPDDPDSTNVAEVRASLLRAIASGAPDTTAFLRYSVPRRTATGTVFDERFWSTVHTPIRGADGAVAFVAQNAIDVTDLYSFDRQSRIASLGPAGQPGSRGEDFSRAQMHEAMSRILSDERSHLRELFNQAPGFIAVVTGAQNVFEIVNEAYYQLVGHRQIIGKPMMTALPELFGQGFEELLAEVRRSGKPFVGRDVKAQLQRVAGAPVTEVYIDVLYQPIFDKDGVVSGIFVQGHDVSEAHAAQQARRDSAERLSDGMVAARMVVWDWDLASRRVVFSNNAELVLGTADGNIDVIHAAIPPADARRAEAARAHAIATRTGYALIVPFVRPDDGRTIWLDVRGKVRCDANGAPVSVRGVTLDITERIKAEDDLRDAHRRKDEFLAMLAHELRNPLAPISSAAQLLTQLTHLAPADTRLQHAADIIVRQVEHISALVDDLIDVSRVTRGLIATDQQPCDIASIVEQAHEQVRPLIEARGHRLALALPAPPAFILGDRKRLVQALSNLLSNAARYTPDGGRIALAVDVDGALVRLRVSDNGIGIGAALLPRVFDLFTQGERSADRAQGGLGVGLAVVKSLVELHGGEVDAASAGTGMGSTFTMSLPLLQRGAPADAGQAVAPVQSAPAPALRLLVVDDNDDAAMMLAMLLEASGYAVSTEGNSRAGLERALAAPPDVCLLDIGLPEMDGYELARRIRAAPALARTTLIAITGYGQPEDKQKAYAAGFDHHLVKPVNTAELVTLLRARADR
ncbi:MAG: ATP-binding protein [Pseudomonadota bacterium]|nr:ATP-binding protein [Pseudomonadota bacterium]